MTLGIDAVPRTKSKLNKNIPVKMEDELIEALDQIVARRTMMGRTIGNTRANLIRDFLWDRVEQEEEQAKAGSSESIKPEDQKAILNLFEMAPDKSQFMKALKSQVEEWIERKENFLKQATGTADKPGKSSTGKRK